jgi:hypothetical protein
VGSDTTMLNALHSECHKKEKESQKIKTGAKKAIWIYFQQIRLIADKTGIFHVGQQKEVQDK